jgi:hypothetical protein
LSFVVDEEEDEEHDDDVGEEREVELHLRLLLIMDVVDLWLRRVEGLSYCTYECPPTGLVASDEYPSATYARELCPDLEAALAPADVVAAFEETNEVDNFSPCKYRGVTVVVTETVTVRGTQDGRLVRRSSDGTDVAAAVNVAADTSANKNEWTYMSNDKHK